MKTGGLALISCCAALLLRKTNPELSFAVSAASVCALLILTLPLAKALNEMRDTMRQLYGMEDAYVVPVLKCCAASLLARTAADLCREASQSAAASTVELMGVLCALSCAMPLIRSMLKTIGELL